jgi:hypothetical protein
MKAWLRKNKIFFETATAASLSAMAVIVAIVQLQISNTQTNLTEAQLEVAKIQIAPRIHTRITTLKDPVSNFVNEEVLEIENVGAPALYTNVESRVLMIASLNKKTSGEKYDSQFFISGYYGITYPTQETQGILFTIKGDKNNNQRMANLCREFREAADVAGFYGDLKLERYVHVSYKDSLENNVEEYFLVEQYRAQRITAKSWQTILADSMSSIGTPRDRDIESIDAQSLIDFMVSTS